jgi:hypothetical protein
MEFQKVTYPTPCVAVRRHTVSDRSNLVDVSKLLYTLNVTPFTNVVITWSKDGRTKNQDKAAGI